ncbi:MULTISPECIES: DUF5684 domain-containing protein [unclassified Microbacterium]|uniref:DUF5684 domain-containing protein n=1 Tax=unclassified Microbacterium TaxID=2609290 RepID=UPI00386FBDA7
MNTGVDSAAGVALVVLSIVLGAGVYVWIALALSAMFRKMGDEPWRGWVPFLNIATVLRWGGFSPWWVLAAVVPIAGQIAVAVLVVISAHRVNPGFGYGAGMTAVAAVLFPVWATILGFGPAPWRGARPTISARPRGIPAPTPASPPYAPFTSAPSSYTPSTTPGGPSPEVESAAVLPPAPSGQAWHPVAPATPPPASVAPQPWAPPSSAADGDVSAQPSVTDAAPSSGHTQEPAPAGAAETAGRPADEPADVEPEGEAPGGTSPIPTVRRAEEWQGEIDEVSAVAPAPFPPSSAAPSRPYVGPPVGAGESGIISSVPGREGEPPVAWLRPQHRGVARDEHDAFPELTGEVSAVVGAPDAGAPVSASRSVSAQQRENDSSAPEGLTGPHAPSPSDADAADPDSSAQPAPAEALRPATPPPVDEVPAATVTRAPQASPPMAAARPAAAAQAAPAPVARGDVEDLDEELDRTVMVRRRRSLWELVPPTGAAVALESDVVIVGRNPAADPRHPRAQLVTIVDPTRTVSKTHARLERRGEIWHIVDLDSTNGVLLPSLLGTDIEVEPGTEVEVAERFLLGDAALRLHRVELSG